MACVYSLIVLAAAFFLLLSLIRWFEQTTEAVERGWWNKVAMLVFMPFTVWFFPSKVSVGRPQAVPRHEPVRGFGGGSKTPVSPEPPEAPSAPATRPSGSAEITDTPPPGTPAAFLVKPVVSEKPKRPQQAVDPDKIAQLRQKMREQGMLEDEK